MATSLPMTSPWGRAAFHPARCNTLSLLDAAAGCVSNSAPTPPCLDNLPSPPLVNYLSAPPFPTAFPPSSTASESGRLLSSLTRGPRSGLTHVYTFARPGQLSALFGRAGPHRKLPGRHAPPRRPFLRLRNLRRPRKTAHPTLGLHRPPARRPFWAHNLLHYFRSRLSPVKTLPPGTDRRPPPTTSTLYTTTSPWP